MLTRSRSYSTETSAEGSQSSQSSDPDSFPHEEHMPSEKKTKGRGKGRGFTRKQNRWVCIMPDSCGGPSADGVCSSSIVSLRDPSTSQSLLVWPVTPPPPLPVKLPVFIRCVY